MSGIPASAMAALDRLTDPAMDAVEDIRMALDSIREEINDDGDAAYVLAMAYDASSALDRLERLLEERRG